MPRSVRRHLGIDLVRPREDSAFEVVQVCEAVIFLEPLHHVAAARATAAMDNDLFVAVNFIYTGGNVSLWNELATKIADVKLVRFANIDELKIGA